MIKRVSFGNIYLDENPNSLNTNKRKKSKKASSTDIVIEISFSAVNKHEEVNLLKKVQELKVSIQKGEYAIEIEKLAEKIIDFLL